MYHVLLSSNYLLKAVSENVKIAHNYYDYIALIDTANYLLAVFREDLCRYFYSIILYNIYIVVKLYGYNFVLL